MIKKIILWTILSIMLVAGFFYINLIIFEKRGAIVTEGYPIENHQFDNVALLVIDIQEYNTGEISNPLINLMNSPLDPGSLGAQLDSRLNIISDYIIPKEKQDTFSNSTLDSILIENEISRLFIVGLDAAFCVNSTIEGARNRGYKIAAIGDAIISDPDTMKNHMMKEFAGKGVEILSTEKFIAELDNKN